MSKSLLFRSGALTTDVKYLVKSYIHVCRYQSNHHGDITSDDYFNDYKHQFVIPFFAKPSTNVQICYVDTDNNFNMGYLIYGWSQEDRHLVIHQLYVNKDDREHGVAKRLIASVYPDYKTKPIICTTYYKILPRLMKTYPNLTFNPYVLLATPKDQA